MKAILDDEPNASSQYVAGLPLQARILQALEKKVNRLHSTAKYKEYVDGKGDKVHFERKLASTTVPAAAARSLSAKDVIPGSAIASRGIARLRFFLMIVMWCASLFVVCSFLYSLVTM